MTPEMAVNVEKPSHDSQSVSFIETHVLKCQRVRAVCLQETSFFIHSHMCTSDVQLQRNPVGPRNLWRRPFLHRTSVGKILLTVSPLRQVRVFLERHPIRISDLMKPIAVLLPTSTVSEFTLEINSMNGSKLRKPSGGTATVKYMNDSPSARNRLCVSSMVKLWLIPITLLNTK